MSNVHQVRLIAIVGGSGAGKGWLAGHLCRVLGDEATHLQLDDFYHDLSHLPRADRARVNFDFPDAIDWPGVERVLRSFRAGEACAVPAYDFASHCRIPAGSPRPPSPLVLVEGLWLLHVPIVRGLFDLTIFLDTPAEIRCSRRLARDVAQRGYTRAAVERRLRTAVLPLHDRFVEPQRAYADLVLTHPWSEKPLLALADRLWTLRSLAHDASWGNPDTFRADLAAALLEHEYSN